MGEFYDEFDAALQVFAASFGSREAYTFVGSVEAELQEGIKKLEKLARNNKNLSYLKGDVAEAYHALTFNTDAARLGKPVRANLPRDTSPYDIIMSNGVETRTAQLKYYNTPDATENASSHPIYNNIDQKVVPSDQLAQIRNISRRRVFKNADSRPNVAKSHEHTLAVASDHVQMNGAKSSKLSEQAAREMTEQARSGTGVDAQKWDFSTSEIIQWSDILRESGTAAMQAAIASVAIQAVPHLVEILKKAFENGEIKLEDFQSLAEATPSAFLNSGIPAGLTAFIVGAAKSGKLNLTFQQLDPSIIALAVLLALNALGTSFRAARGNISWKEALVNISDESFVITMAMAGGLVGQSIIQVPLLGALIGNIVGAYFGQRIIEGKNSVQMALAVETGWTFFGFVEQNYSIPDDVLRYAGYKILNVRRIRPKGIKALVLEPKSISENKLKAPILSRGVISFCRVGYLRRS